LLPLEAGGTKERTYFALHRAFPITWIGSLPVHESADQLELKRSPPPSTITLIFGPAPAFLRPQH